MSLARVKRVEKCRKDQGGCGNCGVMIKKGDSYLHFTVGFRGRTQRRCTKPECYPRPSQRESSRSADAYAAQEEAADRLAPEEITLEDLISVRDETSEAIRAVAEEYESSEMFERNEDLQTRAETLNQAADDIEQWEPDTEEDPEGEEVIASLDDVENLRTLIAEVELP